MRHLLISCLMFGMAGIAGAQPGPAPVPAPPAPPAPPAVAIGSGSYLGIGVQEVDTARAKELKLTEEQGVEVTRVEEESPAAKAGLKDGDVVLQYNGQRVEGVEQFMRFVRETPPGRAVRLLVSRSGATQTLTVTVGERKRRTIQAFGANPNSGWNPEEFQRNMERMREELGHLRFDIQMPDLPAPVMTMRSARLGVDAEPLNEQLATFFGVKEGVLVRSVSKDSAAEKAGIKAGDVITKVNNQPVASPGQITAALAKLESTGAVPVTVVRNKKEMTLNATVEVRGRGAGSSERNRARRVSTRFRFL
jgi:serine protease Do